jgi:hypothetical protein
MALEILYDGIRPAEERQPVEQAVIQAVGNRSGRWKAWLTQGNDEPGFSVRVDGPDGAEFSYRFLKPHERLPEFVFATVRDALEGLNGSEAT